MVMYQFCKLHASGLYMHSLQFHASFSKCELWELASNALAEKGFERCQRRLNPFESNTLIVQRLLDYIESKNKQTLQSRFVGLPSLPELFQVLPFISALTVPRSLWASL